MFGIPRKRQVIHFSETSLNQPRVNTFLLALSTFLLLCLIIYDRVSWASISQWREDQSVNLWLGYTQPIQNIPVGLISSQAIPNPNGMILLGSLLSRLPGLWFISSLLGVLQTLLLILLCWSWFGKGKLFLISSSVLLFSVVLRAISIEFWNQWILLYLDILFFVIMAAYLSHPEISKLAGFLFVILFTPALYLAGISNAAVFALLVFLLIRSTRHRLSFRKPILALSLVLAVIVFSLVVTWIPYLHAIQIDSFRPFADRSSGIPFRQWIIALITLVGFIGWNITWELRLIPTVMFFDGHVLPLSARIFIFAHNFVLLYQFFISFITFGFAILTSYKEHKNFQAVFLRQYKNQGRLIVSGYLFMIFAFALTALLKGPFWINGERIDSTLQFLPFFMIFVFITPLIVNLPSGFQILVSRVSAVLIFVFVIANLALGWQTVESIRTYQGSYLPKSDVPLVDKLQVIQYIATDWKSRSSSTEIPVYYDFDIVLTEERVDTYGIGLTAWYPPVYTLGRAFDYELLRMYHLRNSQEGKLSGERRIEDAVYIISYAAYPSNLSEDCYSKMTINRLNVYVRKTGSLLCAR